MTRQTRQTRTKLAILGMAAGMDRAPFEDPSYEIWALNTHYLVLQPAQLQRVTRWFELHANTALTRSRRPTRHWRNLDALGIPVYSFYTLPHIRRQRRFPLRAVERVAHRRYFACTFAYQIALALHEGFRTIGLYGAPLCSNREALVERPCVEWWLGYAEGRGATVTVEHDEPEGVRQHRGRYAKDDQEERLSTYLYALKHARYSTDWLVDETKRLRLAEVGKDDA